MYLPLGLVSASTRSRSILCRFMWIGCLWDGRECVHLQMQGFQWIVRSTPTPTHMHKRHHSSISHHQSINPINPINPIKQASKQASKQANQSINPINQSNQSIQSIQSITKQAFKWDQSIVISYFFFFLFFSLFCCLLLKNELDNSKETTPRGKFDEVLYCVCVCVCICLYL